MSARLSVMLNELAVRAQLRLLISSSNAQRDFVVVSALHDLERLPDVSLPALSVHARRLSAWLLELSRVGDVMHADALVAALSAIETLSGQTQKAVTLEALVRERWIAHLAEPKVVVVEREPFVPDEDHPWDPPYPPIQEEPVLVVATDVLQGCPSRERRHWDRTVALVTSIEQTYRSPANSRA